MPIIAIMYTAWGRGYSHSIHKVAEVGLQSTKGLVPRMQGDGFARKLGGIMHGGGHVALRTVISWSLI